MIPCSASSGPLKDCTSKRESRREIDDKFYCLLCISLSAGLMSRLLVQGLADFWGITRIVDLINSAICAKILFCDEIESYDKLKHFTYLAHMNSAWHKRSRL